MGRVFLLNKTIITGGPGNYFLTRSSIGEFRDIWQNATERISAIDDQPMADIFSLILDEKIQINNVEAFLEKEDIALVLKINGCLPDGNILMKRKALNEAGYELFKLQRSFILIESLLDIRYNLERALSDYKNTEFQKQCLERTLQLIQALSL